MHRTLALIQWPVTRNTQDGQRIPVIVSPSSTIRPILAVTNNDGTCLPESNPTNLITVTNSCAWDLPNVFNVNARSLNIAKLDELQAIVDLNDVSVAGIT